MGQSADHDDGQGPWTCGLDNRGQLCELVLRSFAIDTRGQADTFRIVGLVSGAFTARMSLARLPCAMRVGRFGWSDRDAERTGSDVSRTRGIGGDGGHRCSWEDALGARTTQPRTVLVVAEGRTRRDSLARARQLLADFSFAGVILNRSSESYGVDNYYGYGYRYAGSKT